MPANRASDDGDVTDSSATTKPAREVSGYSNSFHRRHSVALLGRCISSVV